MARVLMVTWDGGGNLAPLLAVGAELRERGHDVRFAGHPQQAATIADEAGFAFTPYRHAVPWSRTAPRHPLAPFETFVDSGAGTDVAETLAEEAADVAVVDCLMLGALQAAEQAGIATVALVHSFYAYFGQLFPNSQITAMGEPHGRDPQTLWNAATEVLVASDAELDPVALPVPANVHWTGVAQPRVVAPASPASHSRVLLSLSTVWFEGQQEAMQRILDALGELRAEAIATIDRSIASGGLRLAPNVQTHAFVPHVEIMPGASLVIGHGGHATTMLALAHDLPLLVVPQQPMLDQPMVGQVLAARGAGIVVGQDASVDELRDAIGKLLEDESYARAAAAIGARLRAQDGAACAADRIEALVSTTVAA
jgi:UDP:flavonoid glycosyltransferase YjiC (YdhE family)